MPERLAASATPYCELADFPDDVLGIIGSAILNYFSDDESSASVSVGSERVMGGSIRRLVADFVPILI